MRMTWRGSVEGRDRLRLFAALRLPEDAVARLVAWQQRELARAGRVRLVPSAHLHVTVVFLGSRPAEEMEGIIAVLRTAAAGAERPVLTPARYRETRSVGMVVLNDEDARAIRLAEALGEGLERLGVYAREARRWLPHVTVLRFRRAPKLTPPLPDLGPVSPSDLALYHSVLRPSGAQYEIVESVALGGSR
jgi:2'-5' RNA ligase